MNLRTVAVGGARAGEAARGAAEAAAAAGPGRHAVVWRCTGDPLGGPLINLRRAWTAAAVCRRLNDAAGEGVRFLPRAAPAEAGESSGSGGARGVHVLDDRDHPVEVTDPDGLAEVLPDTEFTAEVLDLARRTAEAGTGAAGAAVLVAPALAAWELEPAGDDDAPVTETDGPRITLVESKVERWLRKSRCGPDAVTTGFSVAPPPEEPPDGSRAAQALGDLRRATDALERAVGPDDLPEGAPWRKPAEVELERARTAAGDLEQAALTAWRRDADVRRRRLARLDAHLRPQGRPQEEVLGIWGFLARHGVELLVHLHRAFDPYGADHQLIHLAPRDEDADETEEAERAERIRPAADKDTAAGAGDAADADAAEREGGTS